MDKCYEEHLMELSRIIRQAEEKLKPVFLKQRSVSPPKLDSAAAAGG